jgi:hypothetical protein
MALNVYYPFLHVQFQILSLGVHMVPLGAHLDTQVALKKCPVLLWWLKSDEELCISKGFYDLILGSKRLHDFQFNPGHSADVYTKPAFNNSM